MMDLAYNQANNVTISINAIHLDGILFIPKDTKGIVLFAHGSGSSRLSIRNQFVANVLNTANIATLLFDLLTPAEEEVDDRTLEYRFDIDFLSERLTATMAWLNTVALVKDLPRGVFGASTGGGAALLSAANPQNNIKAVVSRGGRPDLAEHALEDVQCPVLLIVGQNDPPVIKMNEDALKKLHSIKTLEIIPGATHLFEEPGTLEEVATLAKKWFLKYL